MARFTPGYIEHPDRYEAAKQARIRANAAKTRRGKLEAAIAQDSPEFRAWLFDLTPPELQEMCEASNEAFELTGEPGEESRAYEKAYTEWRRRYGSVPTWIREALWQWGGLTDNQLAAARKIFAEGVERNAKRNEERAAKAANALPWTEGRQVVSGVIKSAKYVDSDFGSQHKGLLETEDGRRLWTTIPASFSYGETPVGETMTIKVTIKVANDDPTMAFGSRPTLVAE